MLSSDEQPEKTEEPMLVTLFGIVMLVIPMQLRKAEEPMLVTLLGIVMLVKPLQPKKAESAMPRVPSLITIEVLLGIVPLYLYATLPAYTSPSG